MTLDKVENTKNIFLYSSWLVTQTPLILILLAHWLACLRCVDYNNDGYRLPFRQTILKLRLIACNVNSTYIFMEGVNIYIYAETSKKTEISLVAGLDTILSN